MTFLGSTGINYISEDCGNTIKSYGKDKYFREFYYHPTERNWVLAASWKSCKNAEVSSNCKVSK